MSSTSDKKECEGVDENAFSDLDYIQRALDAEGQAEDSETVDVNKEKPLWFVSVGPNKRNGPKTIDPVALDKVEAAVRDLALSRVPGVGTRSSAPMNSEEQQQQQRNGQHSEQQQHWNGQHPELQQQRNGQQPASPRGVRDNRIGGFRPRIPVRSKSSQAARRLPDRSGSGTLARRAPNRTRSAQVVRRLPDRKGSGHNFRRAVPERNSSMNSLRAFRRDRVENPLAATPLVEHPLYKVGSDCDDSVLSDLDSCYTMDSINLRKSQIMHDEMRTTNDDESETMTDGESVISFNTLDSIVLRRLQIHNIYDDGPAAAAAAAGEFNGSINSLNTTDVQQLNATATFDFETMEEGETDNDNTLFQEGVFTIQESEM